MAAEAAGQSSSSGNVRHWAAGAPIPSCSPRLPGAKDTGLQVQVGAHRQGRRKNQVTGHCPQLHHRHLPEASPGCHSLCPFSPGRRKVDGTAATRSPDQKAGWGEWGTACPGQAAEPRDTPPPATTRGSLGAQRGSPPEWEPGQDWQQNEHMKSRRRLGTSVATSRGWVTRTPAPCRRGSARERDEGKEVAWTAVMRGGGPEMHS